MLFFTDLDNTVIYSHRHKVPGKMIWVESLKDRPQSFVSERVYDFYTSQDFLDVVPLTSRTCPQYERLTDMAGLFRWRHALICNGALLLRDGREDEAWTEESFFISREDRPAYLKLYDLARAMLGEEAIVSSGSFQFYMKTDRAEELYGQIRSSADLSHLSIYRDARKVYCIPKSLDKGTAAERYRARFGHESYIAAGDSEFDIPLLRRADICLCPEEMQDFPAKGVKRICRGLFSDSICDELEKLRNEGAFRLGSFN